MSCEMDARDFQFQRWINRRSEDDCAAILREVAHWLEETRRFQLIDDQLFRSVQRARVVYYEIVDEIAQEVVHEVAEEAVQEAVDRQWQ